MSPPRLPGPLCTVLNTVHIDAGALCRQPPSTPGPQNNQKTNTAGVPSKNAVAVVEAAKHLAVELKSSSYLEGGKSRAALDCSYFVYLVLHSVFNNYAYLNSKGIVTSDQFRKIAKESAKPGDIIYFEPSEDRWWAERNPQSKNKVFPGHVGILISSETWIGRQTGSLGMVRLNDKYFWGTRTSPTFYRYIWY